MSNTSRQDDNPEGNTMSLIESILEAAQGESRKDPSSPHAPHGWTPAVARHLARQEGLAVTEEHWEVVRALHAFWANHGEQGIQLRELHDALDERFHYEGGIKYLYRLFPRGPVAQGCRLAGLKAPAGAADKGFGSVA
jgi:TusE/DsrC/DsvC family sulfur relay protein